MKKSTIDRAIAEAENVITQLKAAAEYGAASTEYNLCLAAANRRLQILNDEMLELRWTASGRTAGSE